MHEASLIENMLLIAEEKLRGYKAERVNTMTVCIGAFSGAMEDALLAAFEIASEQSPLFRGAKLLFHRVPGKARCCRCGNEDEIISFPYACSACGNVTMELTAGQELYLEAMDFEEAQNDGIEA